MDTQKLKAKIGEHEFEAEGPADVVQKQFDAWKELIASLSSQKPAPSNEDSQKGTGIPQTPLVKVTNTDKIMSVNGRIVSLTVKAPTIEDALLLLLFGQKIYRNNESVTGGELLQGVEMSGYRVDRIDRTLEKLSGDGDVIKVGFNRGTRYRLSNQGAMEAQNTAKELIASVAQ